MAKNRNRPRRQHKNKYAKNRNRSGSQIDDLIPANKQNQNQNRKNNRKNRRQQSVKAEAVNQIAQQMFGGRYWCVDSHGKKDENLQTHSS